jgi:hypothetical protein
LNPWCQEKPLNVEAVVPVPKPTQVGECKSTKARERTLSKELCKIAP